MRVITSLTEMRDSTERLRREGRKVGFVPTMGYLHEGHLSLVAHARRENDIVVMSIFVNPAQFGPGEDFEAYPRDFDRDRKLAEEAGVDIIFHPSADDMYPMDGGIRILPGSQAEALCGASRPGHFDGVLKVVLKLFNIVDPDRSYFGMKDAQQLAIIETFVRDFNLRTEIRRVQIVREADGLAKSSRNVNLTAEERREAPIIQRALVYGAGQIGELPTHEVERHVAEMIERETSGTIDYVSVLSYPELAEPTEKTKTVILACAVKFSRTRLIDNIIMSTKG